MNISWLCCFHFWGNDILLLWVTFANFLDDFHLRGEGTTKLQCKATARTCAAIWNGET